MAEAARGASKSSVASSTVNTAVDARPRNERQREEWDILDPSTKRYAHLDMMRVCCVVLVVFDHGWYRYSAENVLYSQSWVLQLLWVISGVSGALGSMGVCKHVARLGIYFVVGLLINWLGFLIAQRDWQGEFHNVVFHLFFIAGLIIFVLLTGLTKPVLRMHGRWRLKNYLDGDGERADTADAATLESGLPPSEGPGREVVPPQPTKVEARSSPQGPRNAKDIRALVIFSAVLLTYLVAQIALGVWLKNDEPAIIQSSLTSVLPVNHPFWTSGMDDGMILGQVTSAVGTLLVAHVGARQFRSTGSSPWLAWLVLAYQFFCRVVLVPCLFGQTRMGRIFSGFELFVLGLTAGTRGMRGATLLRKFGTRYWFAVLMLLALMWDPRWDQRFDENPPEDFVHNLRVVFSEYVCVVGFLTMGENMFDAKIFTEDKAGWLGDWGLLLFLVHWFVHVAVPAPANWIVLAITCPLTFFLKRWKSIRRVRE